MGKKKKHDPKVVQDKVRILGRNNGYVQDRKYGLGTDARWSSDPAYPVDEQFEHPPEPESPDLKKADKWIVDEAKGRDRERAESKPLWQTLRELEGKLSERQKESIRRRLEAGRRASNKKAA